MANHLNAATPAAKPDLVIPLHYFDNNTMFTSITMHAIMVYDEVLDPGKLRSTLSRLVERETWQKLGARLRKGVRIPISHHIQHSQKTRHINSNRC